jgi:hypothetical protein
LCQNVSLLKPLDCRNIFHPYLCLEQMNMMYNRTDGYLQLTTFVLVLAPQIN